MSWDHKTVGTEKYDGALEFLRQLGIRHVELRKEWQKKWLTAVDHDYCRKAAFVDTATGRHYVIEEYIAIADYDCDGISSVDIAVYRAGHRTDLSAYPIVR